MDMARYAFALFLMGLALDMPSTRAMSQPANGHAPGHDEKAVAFVRWYEGYNASQDNFCTIPINTIPYYQTNTFKEIHCSNDEAKSVKMQNLPPGTEIYIYDMPSCGDSDDWGKITILKQSASIIVGGFSHTFTMDDVKYANVWHNGINGKVSCFIIDVPDSNGRHAGPAHDK